MFSYNIQDISTIVGGELIKASGGKISYLLIDSRKILYPRESLFIALRGTRNDGHLFIDDLYKAGVRNYLVEEYPKDKEVYSRANFVKVENSFEAMQKLVMWHRSSIKVPVLGITGSNGKTIIKEWIYQCLSPEKYVIRNPKSFNSQVGVPLSVWHLTPEADLGIFEAGISQPGEMEVLQQIIQPTIGIFTNIGDAHQENFNSLEQKIDEKLKLFSKVKALIYCSDQELVHSKIEPLSKKGIQLFSWGVSFKANLQIRQIVHQQNQTVITGSHKNDNLSITIPFTDKASVENAIHTWCFMLLMGYSNDFISFKLSKLENVAMRLELKEGSNQCTIINDSYNSDLESLHIALDFLSYQNQHKQKVLILSDIAQSGYPKNELYQLVANVVRQKKIDRLIGIGNDISEFRTLFETRKEFYPTTKAYLETNEWQKLHDCTILLKGARVFAFEQIGQLLQKQNHRTIFEIDLNAIEYNINYFKKLLRPATGIIAMLKASGYGSGTHEIANLCQYQRVAAIAVAFPDEGIELRQHGIKTPIWVMNPEEESFAGMIENKLEPQIYNLRSLIEFNKMAGQYATKPFPIHIKLDTGMHRSGFLKEDLNELLNILQQSEHVKVATLFSHLASADEPEQDEFTLGQIKLFEQMSQAIMQQFNYPIKRHILNSAGIERFAEHQFDMVRLGIGMYGISSINAQLAQAGTLTSSIIQLKKIVKGQTVGYSRKGKVTVDSVIATVPVGYADGLRRILSNGVGKVWINGRLAPIIGNVCMDMCMIDVTGLDVNEGDRIEIFGKHLPVNQLAEWMQTIPYEVLTGISSRVKRTYHTE
jgi:alanine racemase